MKYTPPEKLSTVERSYDFMAALLILGPIVIYGLKMFGIHVVTY